MCLSTGSVGLCMPGGRQGGLLRLALRSCEAVAPSEGASPSGMKPGNYAGTPSDRAGSNVPPSFVHRITKYDPADRDEHGHYTGAEEAVSDHGLVEAAYLAAIAAFAEASGIDRLEI